MKFKVWKINRARKITVSVSSKSYRFLSSLAVFDDLDVSEVSRLIIEGFCSTAAERMLNEEL